MFGTHNEESMKTIISVFALSFLLISQVESSGPIDAKSAYGIVADCSDETAKIDAAFAAAQTEEVYFGVGCFGTTGVQTFNKPIATRTAGVALTVFKNLSANNRMFELARQAGGTLGTSFNNFGGFTINQNGSTGDGILGGAQYSSFRDITIHGQGGAGFAFNLSGATLATTQNLNVYQSSNCFKLTTIYYLDAGSWSCERSSGQGLVATSVVQLNMRSLYLDNGGVISSTPAGALMSINSSFSVHIDNFSTEIGPAAPLGPLAFFQIQNSENVTIGKSWISHYPASSQSKCLFMSDNSFLTLSSVEWTESNPVTTILACVGGPSAQANFGFPNNAGNKVLAIRDLITNLSGPGFIVGMWGGTGSRFIAENWFHKGPVTPGTVIDASEVSCKMLGATSISYGAGGGRC